MAAAAIPTDRPVGVRALLACMLIVAGLAFALVPQPRTIDDAFITFRYARNIVEGNGSVYNPGTRTLGTTTPLYTLLMAESRITGSDAYPGSVVRRCRCDHRRRWRCWPGMCRGG